LKPVRFDIPLPWGGEFGFTTAMVFDLGVYLAVLAIIIAVLNELGGVRETTKEPTSFAGPILVAREFLEDANKQPASVAAAKASDVDYSDDGPGMNGTSEGGSR